jgi:hypothetical protein
MGRSGRSSVFKRCGCREGSAGLRRGASCSRLGEDGYGSWFFSLELSPRANSCAERYVGTLRRECLDHLLIYGERHLRRILAEYARHYNEHRPHQSREQRPPLHEPGQPIDMTTCIRHTHVVHGLISEYRRVALRPPETPPSYTQRRTTANSPITATPTILPATCAR